MDDEHNRNWWERDEGYDPDEPLAVPHWLVLTAANLARAAGKLSQDSEADPGRVQVTLTSAARSGNPRGPAYEAYPDHSGDTRELARYWRDISGALDRCLPTPFDASQVRPSHGWPPTRNTQR